MPKAAFLPLLVLALGNATPDVEGLWRTDDGKGLVRIVPCGAQLCGRIVRVLDNGPGVPATDVNNPDPHLRSQPLIGLETLSGFTREGAVWLGGHAYDPKSGRTYRATLQVNPDGSLRLTGCVMFICQSRRWTRAG
jgi:uncharacterized protein (DUF2147 family)